MNGSALAREFVESFDRPDCEHIAEGVIATAENLRDRKISARAAEVASAHFLAVLDATPVPHGELYEPTHLLAIVTKRWASLCDQQSNDGDILVAKAWRKIALCALDLVQTALAREAGRMP